MVENTTPAPATDATTVTSEGENGKPNGGRGSRQLAEVTGVSFRTCATFIAESGVCNLHRGALGDAAPGTGGGTVGGTGGGTVGGGTVLDATTVTSEHLEERNADVRALLKKQKDRFGMPIPEKVLAAFLTTEPKKVAKQLKQIRKFCEKKIFGGDLAFLGLGQQFLIKLDNALGDLKHWTPYCVCRGCHGTGCYRCSDHGFQTKSQYERNPPELKAEGDRPVAA